MRIYPHTILEFIGRIPSRVKNGILSDPFDKTGPNAVPSMTAESAIATANRVRNSLDGTVVFDIAYYDELSDDALMKSMDFAMTLIEHKCFKLPYPNIMLAGPDNGGSLHIRETSPTTFDVDVYLSGVAEDKSRFPMPLYFCTVDLSDGKIDGTYNRNGRRWVVEQYFPYLNYDDAAEDTRVSILRAVAIIAMMRSKSIRIIPGEDTTKLNKQRSLKGKPPAYPINIVKLVPFITIKRGDGKGGTHASPEPHWRRGHVREYKPGHWTDVAPAMVNVADPSTAPVKPTYLIGTVKEVSS